MTIDQHCLMLRAALLGGLGMAAAGCSKPTPRQDDDALAGASSSSTSSPLPPLSVKKRTGPPLRTGPAKCDPAITHTPCKGTEGSRLCSSDADCKESRIGVCASLEPANLGGGEYGPTTCECVYGCSVDADCAPGFLCVCGADRRRSDAACVRATCASGADCDSGVCAVSIYDDDCDGDHRVTCKTADDECSSNDDCAPIGREESHCVYREEKGKNPRWACRARECDVGRPLVVDGVAHVAASALRSDWLAPDRDRDRGPSTLSSGDRALVVAHWLRAGALEHASIASFARFSLQLLAMGAPSDLVAATQRAMGDEIEHAKLCYAIARTYGGDATGPSALPAATAPISSDVRAIATALVDEGCIGEALAAAEAAILADRCEVPEVARALRRVAEDERRHAALAYRALAWMASLHPEIVREVVGRSLAEPVKPPVEAPAMPASGKSRHGLRDAAETAWWSAQVLEVAIRPALGSVFSQTGEGA